jgi:hypothetical protein
MMTNKELESSLMNKRQKIYQECGIDPSGAMNYCQYCSLKWYDSEGIPHCDIPYELGCDPSFYPCARAYNRMHRKNKEKIK